MRARCLSILLLLVVPSQAAAQDYRSVPEAIRELKAGATASARVDAANWLARREGRSREAAIDALVEALRDRDQPVRRAAVNALVASDAERATEALRQHLERERGASVLPALLIALGTLGAPPDAPRIDKFTRHPSPSVRAAAITALARLPHRLARVRSMEALTQSDYEDPTWTMRSAALLALARIGQQADFVPAAAAYLEGNGRRFWFARSAYARMVAVLSSDPVDALFALMQDGDHRVGVTAAEGLARSGNTDLLLRLLTHRDKDMRLVSIGGVEQARLKQAIPKLRTRARHDSARSVRWAAARALFRLDDALGDELMLVAVGSSEPAIWAEAIAILIESTGAEHGRDIPAWREELRRLRAR